MLGDVAGQALDFDVVQAADQHQVGVVADRGRMALGHDRTRSGGPSRSSTRPGSRCGGSSAWSDGAEPRAPARAASASPGIVISIVRPLGLVQRDARAACDPSTLPSLPDPYHTPRRERGRRREVHDCYGDRRAGRRFQGGVLHALVLLDECNTLFYPKGELFVKRTALVISTGVRLGQPLTRTEPDFADSSLRRDALVVAFARLCPHSRFRASLLAVPDPARAALGWRACPACPRRPPRRRVRLG